MKQIFWTLLLFSLLISACGNSKEEKASSLPDGDAERGENLFTQSIKGAPACSACHNTDGTALVGPGFENFGETAAARQSDTSAEDYAYTSITRPGAYVVDGFSNAMYTQYGQRLSDQQIADLIAYLLGL